jgi:hypothetical protein
MSKYPPTSQFTITPKICLAPGQNYKEFCGVTHQIQIG